MSRHRIRGRSLLRAGVAAVLLLGILVPAAALPARPVTAAAKIVINFDAQSSTPTKPGAKLAAGQAPHLAFAQIANAYTKIHPNVQINFVTLPPTVGREEWLQARMLAKDAPDVFWNNFDNAWNDVPKGWYLDMDPYLQQQNPYAPQFKTWADGFAPGILDRVRAPDGHIYEIPADGTGVMMLYNQDMFKKVGITVPHTWDEMMAGMARLQKAGYIPYGGDLDPKGCCTAHWVNQLIEGQLLWDKLSKWDDNHSGYIDTQEIVTHFQKGDWPPMDVMREEYKLIKDFSQYWPRGFATKVDYRTLFIQQKVAMYLEGAWQVSVLRYEKVPFHWSWFDFPVIAKATTPLASGHRVRIFGPWGAEQWFIPAYLKQTDPNKINTIVDFLRFASAPANIGKISAESSFVPNIKGAYLDPGQKPFAKSEVPLIIIQGIGATTTTSFFNTMMSLLQAYLPGGMTEDQFLASMKQAYAQAVTAEINLHPDWKLKK